MTIIIPNHYSMNSSGSMTYQGPVYTNLTDCSYRSDTIVCPNCGSNTGVPTVLHYVGPPFRCPTCGKELW